MSNHGKIFSSFKFIFFEQNSTLVHSKGKGIINRVITRNSNVQLSTVSIVHGGTLRGKRYIDDSSAGDKAKIKRSQGS